MRGGPRIGVHDSRARSRVPGGSDTALTRTNNAGLPGCRAARAESTRRAFHAASLVEAKRRPLPDDPAFALGQPRSTTWLRHKLRRDSDWPSLQGSVGLCTPLVDAHLLWPFPPLLPAFVWYSGRDLAARAPAETLSREVLGRRNTGFGIPVGRWIAGTPVGARASGSHRWSREIACAGARA